MSNVVDFLEQMGRDARLRHATGEAMQAALIQAGIEPPVRAALLGEDRGLLESLVGASHNICCMVNHPEEEQEEPSEDEEEGDEKKKEEPEEEEDEE